MSSLMSDIQAGKPPPRKVAKLSDKDYENMIVTYMAQQNRPYNSQNIFDNLRGAVPKAALLKCIDNLVDSGSLLCKTYGKLKVYLISQNDNDKSSDENEPREIIERELEQLQNDLSELKKTYNSRLFPDLSIKGLREHLAAAREKSAKAISAKASSASSDEAMATETEISALQLKQKEWKKLKDECMEKVDMLAHAMNLDVQTVCEEILDLETDD